MDRVSLKSRVRATVISRLLWAVFLAAWFSVIAFAATPVQVQFTVNDAQAHPVPGATIEVRSGNSVFANATTNDSGVASVAVSASGNYDVTISKSGYVTNQAQLQVTDAPSQQIDMVLPQSALGQQQIEVTANSTTPTTEAASVPSTISGTQAKETPTKPATVIDALPLVPGVVRATDGTVQIAGYGETHSALLVNSVNVTDPATGGFGLSVPIDSVETISVSEMPYLAEYGKFTAGVVAAETRRGGEKWEWSLNDPLPDFRIRSSHLEGIRDASPRLNLSGPVIPGKLYFLEGGEYLLYKRQVYTLPYGQNETKSQAINSFTQLDWIASPNHTLTASFHYAPQSLDFAGLNYFNPQPVTPDANFHESTATFIDRLSIGGGVLQSTFANTHVTSDIRPQGSGDMILTPGGNLGNYFSSQSRGANRYQWMESWKPRTLHFFGDHNLQVGSVLAHSENEGQFDPRPVQIHDNQGNLLQKIEFQGPGGFDLADTEPAFYAQDHWMADPHIAFDIGLRVESQTITHTWRAAPRLGFIWNPEKSSNTVIRGGVGVFYDSVPLDVYAFRSYPEQIVTTYDPTGNVIDGLRTFYNVMERADSSTHLVHRSPVSGNFAPQSLAGHIEVERNIDHFLSLRVKYLQSTAQDLVTLQSHAFATRGALALGSSGWAHTRQLEVIARVGAKENRRFYFSYVRQHARGYFNDANTYLGNFPFPIVRQNLVTSLPSEIPNRFLLWGSYSLPHKFTLTPKFELRNGFPYQYTDVFQNYVSSSSGPQPRFPRYFSADIRLSKDIQVAGKHAVRISGNVLNLTNHFNPLEVHANNADPLFGTFFGNYSRKFTVDFDFLY